MNPSTKEPLCMRNGCERCGQDSTVGVYCAEHQREEVPGGADPVAARGGTAGAGNIVFFGASVDKLRHVGLVEWVDGLTLHTVEGNTSATPGGLSDCVARRTHGLVTSDVCCFAWLV